MDCMTSVGGDAGRPEDAADPPAVRLVSLPHADSCTSWRVQRLTGVDPAAGKTPPCLPSEARVQVRATVLVVLLLSTGLAITLPGKPMREARSDASRCAGTLETCERRQGGPRLDQATPGEAPTAPIYTPMDRARARPSSFPGRR